MADQYRPPGRSARSAPSVTSTNNPRQQQSASLAKRLLFPHLPPGSDLPPLFLSSACPPELNDEVYDFIALALRAFVNTWWTKLSRYDKEFLPQITTIVTHVIHGLEQRLRDADISLLVFSDIPFLVTQHYRDYRQAAAKVSTSYATGGALRLPQLFHQLQPHMAVTADGSIDEEYFRQAFDHILRECLPAEDYAPEPERFIVRELILKIVVNTVLPRITQPWFLQKSVLDILGPSSGVAQEKSSDPSASISRTPSHFSKSSVIVFLLSVIQKLSGACIMLIHTYKQTIHTISLVNQSNSSRFSSKSSPSGFESPQSRDLMPSRDDPPIVSPSDSLESSVASLQGGSPPTKPTQPEITTDLTRGPLLMVSEVLNAQERLATTTLLQTILLFCSLFQSFMNKLLSYMLYTYVLSAASVLYVVRLSKRTLFPNGYPGPPPVDPTPEEQVIIREQLIKRLGEQMPTLVSFVFLGNSPTRTLDAILDPLSNSACNVHLAVFILDALILTLFPEMGVESAQSGALETKGGEESGPVGF